MISYHDYRPVLKAGPFHRVMDRLFVPWKIGECSFIEFLEDAKNYPHLPESAVERLLRMIVRDGLFTDGEILSRMYGRPLRAYRAMYRFSGLEPFIDALVNDFLLPVAGPDFAKQRMLCIVGPRSSGRRHFVQGLADRLDDNPERIPCLQHSEMRTNPLSLLFCISEMASVACARDHRKGVPVDSIAPYVHEVMKNLKLDELVDYNNQSFLSWCQQHGIQPSFEGLCRRVMDVSPIGPVATAIMLGLGLTHATAFTIGYPDPAVWRHLLDDMPDPTLALANYPVSGFRPNSRHNHAVGFAEVSEIEPINYDRGNLIDYECDLSTLGTKKEVSKLRGYLCSANRGILVASNAFHYPDEALVDLRNAQKQKLQLGSTAHVHDELPLGVPRLGFDNVTIVHDDLGAFDNRDRQGKLADRSTGQSLRIRDEFKVISYPMPGFR